MLVYYLNNFFILRYPDEDDYVRLDFDETVYWIYYAIETLSRALKAHDGYSANFNYTQYFNDTLSDLIKTLKERNTDEEVIALVTGLIRTNRGAIISISEMDDPYDIDIIDGRLVAILY